MPVQKTKAIVVGSHPLGEADRIVTLYTRDFGKIRAVARGVRKLKSRLCGRLELLTYGDLIFFERANKDLQIVDSFEIIESFQALREDLMRLVYCSYLAELIQQVESLSVPDAGTFDLLLEIMLMMKTAGDPEVLARTFEIRLLTNAGFSPQLDSCVVCSGDIGETSSLAFSVAKGGVLCGRCREDQTSQRQVLQAGRVIFVSRGTVEMMKRMQRAPLEFIQRLRILEISRREIRKISRDFISFHVDIGKMRSLEFLASIERDKS